MSKFIYGLITGMVAVYIYHKYDARQQQLKQAKLKPANTVTEVAEQIKEVVQHEADKYGTILRKKFEIILPSDLVNTRLEQKSQQFTERRYALRTDTIKQPLEL